MQLYQPAIQGDLLPVTAVSFQQQEGTTDCGVCHELESISFDQAGMREHLITCHKELSLFPETLSAVNRNAKKNIFLSTFTVFVNDQNHMI